MLICKNTNPHLVRKSLISAGFGLIGFYANFYAIDITQFSQFRINFLAGLVFPLVIAQAWGWRYGLVAALFGGCQSMWWLWTPDGYGVFYSVPVFTLWIIWHGIWSDCRRKYNLTRWYYSAYVAEVPFRLVSELGFYTVFRCLVSLNPPPWAPGITWHHVPLEWVHFVVVKHTVAAYVLLLLSHVLLHLGPVRRFLRLDRPSEQKNTTYIVSASILLGLCIWVIDAAAVYLSSIEGSFLDALVLQASPRDLFTRNIVMLICLASGLALSRLLAQRFEQETALRVSEARYRNLSSRLEQRVRARTAELRSANYELEAFAYSVSHDLRAPLRGIDGFSQVLLEDYAVRLDAAGKDYINRIRNATQRMGQLIDDLLELSRMARVDMKPGTVDLSRLAAEIFGELQALEPGRRVRFRVAPDLEVRGDRGLLRVALENLLDNAWKFTGSTEKPEIRLDAGNEKGKTVYFLRDNGAGFDMAYADKLFGAFQRLHGTTEFPGTGIGLATVKRIIHRHGGRIWADAAVDRGATFYFTLPS